MADEVEVIAPVKGRGPDDRSSYDWFPTFEQSLRLTGNITAACEAAGVSRQAAYNSRKYDEFKDRWDDALSHAISTLELEARDRALNGSDTMLIFLLKKLNPEVYGDKLDIEHSGKIGTGYEFTISVAGPDLDAIGDGGEEPRVREAD